MGIVISPVDAARNISDIDKAPGCDGGAIKAYKAFQQEYQNIKAESSENDSKRQLLSLKEELEKNGSLPSVSIGWAAVEFNQIAGRSAEGNQNIDHHDLAEYIRENQYPTTQLAHEFKKNFSEVEALVVGEAPGISVQDINQYLVNQSSNNNNNNNDTSIINCQP